MTVKFVHLHTHSEYSILDSSCKIKALLDRTEEYDMDALALTDHGVMGGAVKFYREAKRRGIKPIIGCEIYLAPGDRREKKVRNGAKYFHLVLLAENERGYSNLVSIVSLAQTEGFYYKPRADKQLLRQYHEGLIALSACQSGEIPRLLLAGRGDAAHTAALEYAEIFGPGNFYIELQDHGTETDKRLRGELVSLARDLDLPLVATNDTHYLAPEDRLAHEVLLNIRANKKIDDDDRMKFDGDGYHFRSATEMEELFSDIPEAIDNTRVIADRCNVEIEFGHTVIPPFPLPEGITADEYLRKLAYEGAHAKYDEITRAIEERLEYELSVIERMKYATYFLIVWDFVRFSKEQHIPVGPGRGSATGSLVSYCIGITRVDPLRYSLIFERFLNPERVSMPDFDIDFCVKGRDRVIAYVREKYGRDCTAQIATYDRMAARSVVRDVGRVLGASYGTTDHLAKLIPYGLTLRVAVEQVAELHKLYESDPEVKKIVDIGLRLEGLARNTSTHAAGVVVATRPLQEIVPLLRLGEGEIVTQYDMTDVEAVGLLKFDFLGLRNLTLLDEACTSLRTHAGIDVDLDEVPLDDEKTFEMIRAGKTAGIFQLEGSGMTSLIRRVEPDRFEDLIALLALYRPGPLESGMTNDYVERRHGRQKITYPHPSLSEVLDETYGLPIYQDQIMLMAQKLAGFSLAEADILRKAMGKKNKVMMASMREKFMAGCLKNDISEPVATQSFDDMEKFSRYGFNKSHTTAYAFISYWTAYLKANYPTHFMASLLASVQGDLDKVASYIGQCRRMGIEVLPPDINESEASFTPTSDSRIRFGLAAIKHVGKGAIAAILAVRKDGFSSFFDVCRRVDGADRDTLEALIKAGAFGSFGSSRRGLLMHVSQGVEMMQIARHERQSGQQSFFGGLETAAVDPIVSEEEFPQSELLEFEKEFLGLYISADPLDQYRDVISLYCRPLSSVSSLREAESAVIGGRITAMRRIATKKGDQMAFITMSDGDSEAEVTIFPRVLETASSSIDVDLFTALRVTAGRRNGDINLVADEAIPLESLEKKISLSVNVTLGEEEIDSDRLTRLKVFLAEHPGDAPFVLRVDAEDGRFLVRAGKGFCVCPTVELQRGLEEIVGVGRVRVSSGGIRED
ncbi:MAG: DNA polymerase III subunit alpha [Candidatus Bipolaricaulota bacterium]|nr:DNA polymerase III subunit alpha [Candidatus Bipolaricaulota bacterium]